MAGKAKTTKPAPAKTAKPSKKQKHLPGLEPELIEAIQTPAMKYAEVRDARMALSADEVKLREQIEVAMKAHNLTSYEYEDVRVDIVTGKAKAKVKIGGVDTDD